MGLSVIFIAFLYDLSYLFPLLGGTVTLVGVLIEFFSPKNRTAGILIQFFGLSVVMIFLFEYLASSWMGLANAQLGLYLFLTGTFLAFIEVIWSLTLSTKKE
ncbi:MAG TPA: hypothetical protein VKK79_13305 [Candidatus Lokiarchaeia archaeon]|nr:hypothetical protein [Candidatus Lokiarchaeia archaeon]